MPKPKKPMSTGRKIAWAVSLTVFVLLLGVLAYTLIGISDNGDTLRRIGEDSQRLREQERRANERR